MLGRHWSKVRLLPSGAQGTWYQLKLLILLLTMLGSPIVLLKNTVPPAHVEPLTYLKLNSRRKALVNISWRHPPAHSWYRCEGPGAAIRFKGVRKDQTALARLSSGHLKTLRFSRGDKKFNICTKRNMAEATLQHLFDCVALVYDDLLKRPDFVLDLNDLMDLI
ncbi:hypothetical protein AVEN_248395-1 [Araneus ventricosus]|uniref:Uncharacterized protein n=1 Tax=Araneus ventricosus TaxID=182803 RepID=A0A4Y2L8W7_ARAVE|nr:hypothetical protein AVEN_248395-1 [Araneus ventricosus]